MEELISLLGPLDPIACRVCGKVFFDNVSLVFHFECHLNLEDKTSSFGQQTSLQGDGVLPSSFSSHFFHSSVERTSRACPLHVSSALGQKFSAAHPMSNAGFSLPVNQTTMFKKRSIFCGLNPVNTPMMSNGRYGNNLRSMQCKTNPLEESVVVSDDEEEEKEIDLTLKL